MYFQILEEHWRVMKEDRKGQTSPPTGPSPLNPSQYNTESNRKLDSSYTPPSLTSSPSSANPGLNMANINPGQNLSNINPGSNTYTNPYVNPGPNISDVNKAYTNPPNTTQIYPADPSPNMANINSGLNKSHTNPYIIPSASLIGETLSPINIYKKLNNQLIP